MDDRNAASTLGQLQDLYAHLQQQMRTRWHRDLPFDELLFDRWARAASLGFGDSASIYHNSYVYGDVSVGDHTWIGPFTILDGSGGALTIGDYCSISAGVQIYTHDSVRWALSGGACEYQRGPVQIGDRCYIGSHTVVTRNVTIGDGSLIAAAALVNRNVPPGAIVGGVPCRMLGRVVGSGADLRLEFDGSGHERDDR